MTQDIQELIRNTRAVVKRTIKSGKIQVEIAKQILRESAKKQGKKINI